MYLPQSWSCIWHESRLVIVKPSNTVTCMALWPGYGCAFYFTSQPSPTTGTIFLYTWRAFSSRGLKALVKYKGPADIHCIYLTLLHAFRWQSNTIHDAFTSAWRVLIP